MGHAFKVGERVKVFDRYRLGSHDVFGVVAKLSDTNDGVEVNLDATARPVQKLVADNAMWFRPQQLVSCDLAVAPKQTLSAVCDGLKEGKRYYRRGWNGKAMRIELQVPDANSKMTLPYVYLVYGISLQHPDGVERVPWLCSQTDFLADDWVEVS